MLDKISIALINQGILTMPWWKPVFLQIEYELYGGDVFECSVPVWYKLPGATVVNWTMGWIAAKRCEIYAWFCRLCRYGTSLEKVLACLWFVNVARILNGA